MAESLQSSRPFTGAVVVMGVASCGKTTVGEALARRLGVRFIEGDRLHSPANVAKMSAGTPLSDEDRWPWLSRIGAEMHGEKGCVAACSALKRSYRKVIAEAAERPLSFVHLHGPREVLAQRIAARTGHFMPASLLDSQLATLEMPGGDESAIVLDVSQPPEMLVELALAYVVKL